ncbi:sugar-binding domain-containing protein [Asticcacaulis biprosthecium]|uniref:sugar-binding domain-containing protein n=1 Tax=Asticcacaulis biprosthecium TaxID=76891 RepID=UPI0002D6DDCE|nr:sugar-binding domain-containing protein [Asticcacaulis biprosthecium]
MTLPDDGWNLWIDQAAQWQDDAIYLPSQVDIKTLPVNPPTGGWGALTPETVVTLPATVEQHFWGRFGLRPYTGDEYRYAEDDDVPQNGAWRGVSWWWRDIDIPAEAKGKRVLLHIRGARLRAEVFLNEKLVGYSIMSELPFDCDVTKAMKPGQPNRLTIRITNPGGRYDWRDSTTMMWGKAKLFASHGFGGLDRGMSLSFHPIDHHITDAWVLNTPDPHVVTGHIEVTGKKRKLNAVLLDADLKPVPADIRLKDGIFTVSAPNAKLWDLDNRHLYHLRFSYGVDTRDVRFGFRWFGVDGLGTDAVLRLNGKRIKLYSAISWGYWGYNGMWPTPVLARREIDSAKALGLNTLHAHRNVGKADVFKAQDEQGLLRVMEPGGGRHAIAKDLKPGETLSEADIFSRAFMVEKCVAMAKAFRSHPSLAHYTLQNEIGANLANPDVQAVLKAIHDTDPSRIVILNDGFVARGAAQAMYLPYSDHYYRSDVEEWGGWWVNHQGAGDQWYDKFYQNPDDYIHYQPGKPYIVEFGEMQGCAVADNHVKLVADIKAHGGKSYDLHDHTVIVENTSAWLDTWGFRKAFPTTESLFLSVGRKAYDAWQHYCENIRIGDSVDIAAISGWETTAIENHSGIVDNLRYFKANPDLIKSSLLPVRPVAKTKKLAFAAGETAELDVWLLNDTDTQLTGTLKLSLVTPDGKSSEIQTFPVPQHVRDQFSYLLAEKITSPVLTQTGLHKIILELPGHWTSTFTREIWVTDTKPAFARPLKIGVSGIAKSFRDQLAGISAIAIEDFKSSGNYDAIIASGLKAEEIERRQIAEQTGLEAQPKKGEKPVVIPGELPPDVLDAVRKGTPLLAMVPEDGLADGIAKQLAELGLFTYSGQVGNLRAPWMGNWNFLRAHALFDGIPADQATSVLHQIPGEPSNGLKISGNSIEVIAGYSRDHDRHNGAASFTVQKAGMRVIVHRLPDMVAPLQKRFLINALKWMTT